MMGLNCRTKIIWTDLNDISREGIIIKVMRNYCTNDGDSVSFYYGIIESDTGTYYGVKDKDIKFVNVDGEWVNYKQIRLSDAYRRVPEAENAVRHDYKFNSFEAILHPDRDNVECKLEFSASFEDASKLRNTFDNNRDMADSMVYGICNYLDRIGMRIPGRYPWGNASAINFQGKYYKTNGLPVPKKVIFNGPATVVLWTDNTKTVVKKSEDEPDDREKALMYCVFKKFLNDKKRDMDRYLKLFYKVLEEEESNEEKKD